MEWSGPATDARGTAYEACLQEGLSRPDEQKRRDSAECGGQGEQAYPPIKKEEGFAWARCMKTKGYPLRTCETGSDCAANQMPEHR
jgi:hypothetical protein